MSSNGLEIEFVGVQIKECSEALYSLVHEISRIAEVMNTAPDYDLLLRQSFDTAEDAMRTAKDRVNKLFGDGAAASKPELVVAFMSYAAQDFATMVRSGVRS